MEKVSILTNLLFGLSTAFVVYQLFKATHRSRIIFIALITWVVIISILGVAGFYRQGYQMPPRFLFLVGPGLLAIILMFVSNKGREFIDSLNIADLTLLHAVRLPVEIVLYQLYAAALIPQIMTFEGWNFDIITGLSAPAIFYIALKRTASTAKFLLAWNLFCLMLLFIIMAIAILSTATPFQQFGFEQPNIGVTYFPYVWLPGVIVPAVLFSHLVSIRILLLTKYRHLPQKARVIESATETTDC